MLCFYCGGESAVVDSRDYRGFIKRKRRCKVCFEKWNTLEITEELALRKKVIRLCKKCGEEAVIKKGYCYRHLLERQRFLQKKLYKSKKLNLKLKG